MIRKVPRMSRKKIFLPDLWVNPPISKTNFYILEITFDERRDSQYDPAKSSFGGGGKRPKRKWEPL
jgi:hypothetical protein